MIDVFNVFLFCFKHFFISVIYLESFTLSTTVVSSNTQTASSVHQLSNLEHIKELISTTINENRAPINCVLSEWTNWSNCSVTCGPGGFSEKYRHILVQPQNGGLPCARKLTKRKRCSTTVPCVN